MKLLLLFLLLTYFTLSLRNSGTIKGTPLSMGWQINNDEISIEFHSKKLMFIPILLNSKMVDSDLWLCSKEKSKWQIHDYWSTGHKDPIPDHKVNGSEDLTHLKINVTQSQITCGFKRKLQTDDSFDIQLYQNQTIRICSQDSDTLNLTKHKTMHDVFCWNWTLKEGVKDHEFEPERLKPSPNIKLLHGVVLTIGWGFFIDLGIMIVRYFRTLKYYKLAHILIFISVNFSSIPLIVMLIIREQKPIFNFFSRMSLAKKIHTILGFATLILLIVEHILGMIAQEFQENQKTKAKKYRILQIAHKIVGYSLYVITKVEVVNGWWIYKQSKTLVMFIMGVWFCVLFISFITLQHLYKSGKLKTILSYFEFKSNSAKQLNISDQNIAINQSLISVDSLIPDILNGHTRFSLLKQYPKRKFYFFKNMICELKDFSHPGANSLTNQTIGKDVTKYVYGMVPLEGNRTRAFEHSSYTVSLLEKNSIGVVGKNLCRLDSKTDWRVKAVGKVSSSVFKIIMTNNTFEMKVFPENSSEYVGKYWLITTKSATRAYTLLLSQSDENIKYRNSLIDYADSDFSKQVQVIDESLTTNEVTCIIKKYDLGVVSNQIHENDSIKQIEGLYGLGLDVKQGLNIIVTGGTGILPFLDLFDILLKKAIYLSAKRSNNQLPQNLTNHLFKFSNMYRNSKFIVYSSFKDIEEFHYHSWLVKLHIFSIKYNLDIFELNLRGFEYSGVLRYDGRVDQEFLRVIKDRGCQKVFCCGPPEMNDEVFRLTQELGYQEDIVTVL